MPCYKYTTLCIGPTYKSIYVNHFSIYLQEVQMYTDVGHGHVGVGGTRSGTIPPKFGLLLTPMIFMYSISMQKCPWGPGWCPWTCWCLRRRQSRRSGTISKKSGTHANYYYSPGPQDGDSGHLGVPGAGVVGHEGPAPSPSSLDFMPINFMYNISI